MAPDQFAFDFIENCRGDSGIPTLLSKLADCGRRFGFDHFILTGLPPPNGTLEEHVLANDWPEEWYQRYTDGSYFHCDGVGQWALRTWRPFRYDEVPDMYRLPRQAREIREEAKSFGLADGFVVPVRSTCHRQSVLSFSCAARCDLGPDDRRALQLVAIYAEGVIRDCLNDTPDRKPLTVREREVLAWAADGKSAWETSVILSISERTVVKHLEHVRAKLNVATTAQAVAKGIGCGEIIP